MATMQSKVAFSSELMEKPLKAANRKDLKAEKGGFDCEFVKKPPETIQSECPVCLQILCEPYQAPCCGNSFCRVCIERIKNDNKPCPTCKEENFNTFHDKRLQRSLYGYQVYCSHKQEGCEWKGELGQLDNHLNLSPEPDKQLEGCEYCEIECIYCSELIKRSNIAVHQNDLCSKRPFSCEYCHSYESHYEDVIHNHWPVCGYHPVRCPNECGTFPKRQALENHVTRDCPFGPNVVTICDFHHVGCDVRLPRKDMPDHLKENLITHMSLQAASYSKLLASHNELHAKVNKVEREKQTFEGQLEAKRQENQAVKQQIDKLEETIKAKSQSQEFANLGLALAFLVTVIAALLISYLHNGHVEELRVNLTEHQDQHAKIHDEVKKLNQLLPQDKEQNELQSSYTELNDDTEKLKQLISQGKEQNEQLQSSYTELHDEVEKLKQLISPGKEQNELQSSYTELHDEIEKLKQLLSQDKEHNEQLQSSYTELHEEVEKALSQKKPNDFKKDIIILVILASLLIVFLHKFNQYQAAHKHTTLKIQEIIHMGNFQQLKTNTNDWYSPPLYTHPGGYKFCLRVYANGNSEGEGTHVSVFVCLMRGEFDDDLKWPFRGDITVQLVDQEGKKKHRTKTIHFNDETPDNSAGRVTKIKSLYTLVKGSGGWGDAQFISHEKLKPKYLKNDCLRFKVAKVTL